MLKTVAIVAGAVALIAGTAGLLGPAIGLSAATTATLATVATAASIAATAASLGAGLLTKPPPARGSETRIQVAVEPPSPCLLGEAYSAGILRHDVGYGATLKKVPNPFRWLVCVYSVAGPLTACTPMVDFAPVSSYYTGFLATDTQLGAAPESTALVPPFGAAPGWSSSSKLSGNAAIGWNLKFDKDGKRFASGLPALGAVWKGPGVYDPRQDSTYPGGSGPCRIDDESTWVWDGLPGDLIAAGENPGLHAITYAYGRRQNGKQVFGIGQPVEGIDLARFVAFANVCAANGWRLSGTIYEPGDSWANLKDILSAGCAEPVETGGVLSVRYRAPQVSLATITEADLAGKINLVAMQEDRDRLNGIFPKFRDPASNWEFATAGKVSVPTFVSEDGEDKSAERQWNLVRDVDQAAQLAMYALWDGRELGPVELVLQPQWRWVKPGFCLTLHLPVADFDGDVVVLKREIDPATMTVKLTVMGETEAKHAYALGQVGTPPPTPALGQTAEERDAIASAAIAPPRAAHEIVGYDPPEWPLSSTDTTITVAAFDGTMDDGSVVSFPASSSLTGLTADTVYGVFYDLSAGTYSAIAQPATSERADSDYAFVGWQRTAQAGGTTYTPPDPPPGGFGGGGGFYRLEN